MRKLFFALATMMVMTAGTVVYESASFAQNSNSSTTTIGNSNKTGAMHGRRRHRRRHRRGRKPAAAKTGNANQ
jgi:hypothetical protein